jgi:hypothetical protein
MPPSSSSSSGPVVGEIIVAVPPPPSPPQAHEDAADRNELPVATAQEATATSSSPARMLDAAARAALAATASKVGVVVVGAGANIPTTLRNLKSRNSNSSKRRHSSGSSTANKNKRTRDGTTQEEGELAQGGVAASEVNPRHGSSSSPSSSSKGSKRTTPANALPHYRCARSTYESSIEAASSSSVFSSDEAVTAAGEATPLSSPHAASLRFVPHFPQPPPPQIPHPAAFPQRPRQRVSAPSLWQACTAAAPAATSSASQRARRLLSQEPQEDTLAPMPTLEAMLLRQKQDKPALESMEGDINGTKNVEAAAAAPHRSVASLTDHAPRGALLKPRRTSPVALPADFAPSKADVVVELQSESSANRGSAATSQSSGASTASSLSAASSPPAPAPAPANACRRRAGSAPAYEAMLNRHLLAYIESTRRSRSHLVDHLLALVERSGGRFCRFDRSCHRWIQVGYETSFDVCAAEFKAGARDVLKRIQLLRSLERQEKQESGVVPTPGPVAQSQERGPAVLRTGQEHQSADSHSIRPKPPPGTQLWQGVSVMLHQQPPTATSQDPPPSQLTFPGRIASNPGPPSCMSSRERKLQTKFKRPKMKASPSTHGSDSASSLSASAAHPTSPMPRRVTNEQEATTSADIE